MQGLPPAAEVGIEVGEETSEEEGGARPQRRYPPVNCVCERVGELVCVCVREREIERERRVRRRAGHVRSGGTHLTVPLSGYSLCN